MKFSSALHALPSTPRSGPSGQPLSVFDASANFGAFCEPGAAKSHPGRRQRFGWSGRRFAPTAAAVLGLVARRTTRCAHCVRYAQTGCDKSVYEARCARGPSPVLLGARSALPLPGAPLRNQRWLPWNTTRGLRGRRYPAGAICGAARSTGWGRRAQRASWADSPHLSERSERSERSELCGAAPGRAPQRSRRKRRPLHHEPLPVAACRDALNLRSAWKCH